MKDRASVYGNTAVNGGGVCVDIGTFTMQNSASVHDNTATSSGGGGVEISDGELAHVKSYQERP